MVDYSPALMTDMYEYTMLDAALKDGTADRKCVFEVFTRHLPEGRRYGVVAGTGRILDALEHFHLDEADLKFLVSRIFPMQGKPLQVVEFLVLHAIPYQLRGGSHFFRIGQRT